MIKPLWDNIVLEQKEVEEKTLSGIIIAKEVQERPQEGVVFAVCDNSMFKVGDVVLYKKWGGSEVKVDNKDYIIIEEKDILAKV